MQLIPVTRSGQFEPTQASLIRLADYFHVTIDYLLHRQFGKKHYPVQAPESRIFHILTSYVPLQAKTDIDGYEEISTDTTAGENYFALRVTGKKYGAGYPGPGYRNCSTAGNN